jgi:hypothetical protein
MHLKWSFRGAREREPGIQKLRFDASKFQEGLDACGWPRNDDA